MSQYDRNRKIYDSVTKRGKEMSNSPLSNAFPLGGPYDSVPNTQIPWEQEQKEKKSQCCSRLALIITMIFLLLILLALCGCIVYLKFEMDAIKSLAEEKINSLEERGKLFAINNLKLKQSNKQDISKSLKDATEVYNADSTSAFFDEQESTESDLDDLIDETPLIGEKDFTETDSEDSEFTDEESIGFEEIADSSIESEEYDDSEDTDPGPWDELDLEETYTSEPEVDSLISTVKPTYQTSKKAKEPRSTTTKYKRKTTKKTYLTTKSPNTKSPGGSKTTTENPEILTVTDRPQDNNGDDDLSTTQKSDEESNVEEKITTKTIVALGSEFTTIATTEDNLANKCPLGQFQCANLKCINATLRCNRVFDCDTLAENNDEANCKCVEIFKDKLCDGYSDCPDAADEENCNFCPPSAHQCSDGHCLSQAEVCNGIVNCVDGSDENVCTKLSEDFDQSDLKIPSKSGYLLYKAFDAWYPVCYKGTSRDEATNLSREEKALVDICATFTGAQLPRLQFNRVPLRPFGNRFDKFLQLSGAAAKITDTCNSGIIVHVDCPDKICGSNTSVTVQQHEFVFLKPSQHGDWPSNVFLYSNGLLKCNAAILDQYTFVTSATCVEDYATSYLEIRTGSVRHQSLSPYDFSYTIDFVLIHPDFTHGSLDHDIALLKVNEPITFNAYVNSACLPRGKAHYPKEGSDCRVLGLEGENLRPDQLWDTGVKINSTCDANNTLCIDLIDGGCQETVGGGLYCREEDSNGFHWYLAALVNKVSSCDQSDQGRYLIISKYIDWINEKKKGSILDDEQKLPIEECPGHSCRGYNGVGCIPKESYCDKLIDCLDASDETICN